MLAACWLTIATPEATAETYMVVINANNRVSGSDAELREVVSQLYLKQETRWPDDLPALPIARPNDNPATAAFAEAILGTKLEDLEHYWAETGDSPPDAIGPVRQLLRQVSRTKGAFSVVAAADAKRLPAKVRVLFEFTTTAPGEQEQIRSPEDVLAYIRANKRLVERKLAYYTDRNQILPKGQTPDPDSAIKKFEIVDILIDGVVGKISYTYGDPIRVGRTVDATILFHLQWINDHLEFVGHGDAALAALSDPTLNQPSSFDGIWELEIVDQSAPYSPGKRTVQIVDNKFSVEVTVAGKRGIISGEIDRAGTLVGTGALQYIVGREYGRGHTLEFMTRFTDGRFQTTTVSSHRYEPSTYTIKLTRS